MNILTLQKEIEAIFKQYKVEPLVKIDSESKIYTIDGDNYRFEVTVSNRLVGYDLVVKKRLLGRELGSSMDTDLYPLGGKYLEITKQIFGETKLCLESLLSNRVFVGETGKGIVLAIPDTDTTYRVECFRSNKKIWQIFNTRTSSEKSLSEVKEMQLKPLI